MDSLQDEAFFEIAKRDAQDGQHRNPTAKASYFTTSFFHHPDELRAEVLEAGFERQSPLQVEGAAVFLQDLDEQWAEPVLRERILETIRWLEAEPATLGVTGHMMRCGIKEEKPDEENPCKIDQELAQKYGAYASYPTDVDPVRDRDLR